MTETWDALSALIPDAKKLKPAERKALGGWMRRSIWMELEEEQEAACILAAGDIAGLTALIASLPLHAPEEKNAFAAELNLSAEETQLEAANWPYRHQAAKGQLLVGPELVAFTLIRLGRHAYLLLARQENQALLESFSRAFGRAPDVRSARVFRLPDQAWFAWAWFVDPDPGQACLEAGRLRELWKDLEET